MEQLTGTHLPLANENMGWECPLNVPIDSINGRTFPHWVLRQPIKMGGLGIRSQVETSPAAFIGGLEQALPHLTGPEGVCQNLVGILGEGTQHMLERWQPLLNSGCRTGQEFRRAWEALQSEAQQSVLPIWAQSWKPLFLSHLKAQEKDQQTEAHGEKSPSKERISEEQC